MKIKEIRLTPLFCKFKQPYVWAQGVNEGADVILIELKTDQGITGIAEAIASPTVEPVLAILKAATPHFLNQPVHDSSRLITDYYRYGFNSRGTGSAPRYFAQAMTGVELAMWDAVGKAARQPLHKLLGGAVRDRVHYFGFVQGDTPKELAAHGKKLAKQGFQVIYAKVGRGAELDLAITRGLRKAIGKARLRLDANEAWNMHTARLMFDKLQPYDIDFIEQPIPSAGGAETLAKLRAKVGIPIAADQAVFSPEDVFSVCRAGACDVITLGIHETCGVTRFRKAAAVAEAAAINICIHGVFETGITTCAANQVAATIPNLDDGNQIMWQLLKEDVVEKPSLTPVKGALPIGDLPGLGFTLDWDAVGRAAEAQRKRMR